MKIIKQGVVGSPKTVEITCPECGCVFEATRDEFRRLKNSFEGDSWKIKCPTDGCKNILYTDYWRNHAIQIQ